MEGEEVGVTDGVVRENFRLLLRRGVWVVFGRREAGLEGVGAGFVGVVLGRFKGETKGLWRAESSLRRLAVGGVDILVCGFCGFVFGHVVENQGGVDRVGGTALEG